MELLDLMIEIERYMSRRGLSYSDSISDLIDAMGEDASEEF